MQRIRWFVIAHVLVATVCSIARAQDHGPRADARATSSWSSCRVLELSGTVREIRCPDFMVRVFRGTSRTDAAQLAALAATIPDAGIARPGELAVDDRTVPTSESRTVLLVIPFPGVVAGCTEPEGERRDRCRAAIVEMARTRQLPPGVHFPDSRMSFLGRELTLPSGCSMMGEERMTCPATQASFDWRERPAREDDTETRALELLVRMYRSRFRVRSESSIACSMRGVSGSGIRLSLEVQNQPVDFVLCSALSDQVLSIGMCFGALPPGRAWPEPCSQVFEGPIPELHGRSE